DRPGRRPRARAVLRAAPAPAQSIPPSGDAPSLRPYRAGRGPRTHDFAHDDLRAPHDVPRMMGRCMATSSADSASRDDIGTNTTAATSLTARETACLISTMKAHERRATSDERRATSDERRATSDERR